MGNEKQHVGMKDEEAFHDLSYGTLYHVKLQRYQNKCNRTIIFH
jgi:hypothetical protein